MKKEDIKALFRSYEDAVCMIDGTECWSARELQKLLGYSLWQNFSNVINKAKDACINVGNDVNDHFIDVNKMVELGSGAHRVVDDIMLTRFAAFIMKWRKNRSSAALPSIPSLPSILSLLSFRHYF